MIDSSTNAPFYVGKGKDDRMRYHEKRVRSGHPLINKHLYHKLKKLLNDNVIILYQKTLSDVEESTAFLEETRLIKEIGRADLGLGPLCNLTDGGDGSAGLKSTLNNLRKRRSMAGINNPMFGMHHSTDSKRVISEKRRRRTTPFRHSMQHRDKLRQFNPGGDKTSKPIVQMNSNGDTVEHWKSIRHAGKTLGIRFGNISNAIKNHPNWKVGGYLWRYETDTSKIATR